MKLRSTLAAGVCLPALLVAGCSFSTFDEVSESVAPAAPSATSVAVDESAFTADPAAYEPDLLCDRFVTNVAEYLDPSAIFQISQGEDGSACQIWSDDAFVEVAFNADDDGSQPQCSPLDVTADIGATSEEALACAGETRGILLYAGTLPDGVIRLHFERRGATPDVQEAQAWLKAAHDSLLDSVGEGAPAATTAPGDEIDPTSGGANVIVTAAEDPERVWNTCYPSNSTSLTDVKLYGADLRVLDGYPQQWLDNIPVPTTPVIGICEEWQGDRGLSLWWVTFADLDEGYLAAQQWADQLEAAGAVGFYLSAARECSAGNLRSGPNAEYQCLADMNGYTVVNEYLDRERNFLVIEADRS